MARGTVATMIEKRGTRDMRRRDRLDANILMGPPLIIAAKPVKS